QSRPVCPGRKPWMVSDTRLALVNSLQIIVTDGGRKKAQGKKKTQAILSYFFLVPLSFRPGLAALVCRPDHDEAAVGTGNCALDQDGVVAGVDAANVRVADVAALTAVPSGHANALLGPAATAVTGIRGDAAVLPVALLDAVAAAQTLEVVSLHDAGEAAAL